MKANKIRSYQASRNAQYQKAYEDDIKESHDSYDVVKSFAEYLENLHPYTSIMRTVSVSDGFDGTLKKMCLGYTSNSIEESIWLIGVYNRGTSTWWSHDLIWYKKQGQKETWNKLTALSEPVELKLDSTTPIVFSSISDAIFIKGDYEQSIGGSKLELRFAIIGVKNSAYQAILVHYNNSTSESTTTETCDATLYTDAFYEGTLNQTSALPYVMSSVGNSVSGTLSSETILRYECCIEFVNSTYPTYICYNKCFVSPTIYWNSLGNIDFYIKTANTDSDGHYYYHRLEILSSTASLVSGYSINALSLKATYITLHPHETSVDEKFSNYYKIEVNDFHKTFKLIYAPTNTLLMYSSLSSPSADSISISATSDDMGYIVFRIKVSDAVSTAYHATIYKGKPSGTDAYKYGSFHYHTDLKGEWTGNAVFIKGITYNLSLYKSQSGVIHDGDLTKSFLENLGLREYIVATGYSVDKAFTLAEFKNSNWVSKSYTASNTESTFQSTATKSYTYSLIESIDTKWLDYVESSESELGVSLSNLLNVYQVSDAYGNQEIMIYELSGLSEEKHDFIVKLPNVDELIKFTAAIENDTTNGVRILTVDGIGERLFSFTKRWYTPDDSSTYVESIHQTILCISGGTSSMINENFNDEWSTLSISSTPMNTFKCESYKLSKPNDGMVNEHYGFVFIGDDVNGHILTRSYNPVSKRWSDTFDGLLYSLPFCHVNIENLTLKYTITSEEQPNGKLAFKWDYVFEFYDDFIENASIAYDSTDGVQCLNITLKTVSKWCDETFTFKCPVSCAYIVDETSGDMNITVKDDNRTIEISGNALFNSTIITSSNMLYYTRSDSSNDGHVGSMINVYNTDTDELVIRYIVVFDFSEFIKYRFRENVNIKSAIEPTYEANEVKRHIDKEFDNNVIQLRNDYWERLFSMNYETVISTSDRGAIDRILLRFDIDEIPSDIVMFSPASTVSFTCTFHKIHLVLETVNESQLTAVSIESHLVNKNPTFVFVFDNSTYVYTNASVSIDTSFNVIKFTISATRTTKSTGLLTSVSGTYAISAYSNEISSANKIINLRHIAATQSIGVYQVYPMFTIDVPDICVKNNVGVCYDSNQAMIIPLTNNIYALEEVRAPLVSEIKSN